MSSENLSQEKSNDSSEDLYTILMTCSVKEYKNPKNITYNCTLGFLPQNKKIKKKYHLYLSFQFNANEGVYSITQCNIFKTDKSFWTHENKYEVVKAIFNFFLRSRHTCSRTWTEGWLLKKVSKHERCYKMYDCSIGYLKLIVKHYKDMNELIS